MVLTEEQMSLMMQDIPDTYIVKKLHKNSDEEHETNFVWNVDEDQYILDQGEDIVHLSPKQAQEVMLMLMNGLHQYNYDIMRGIQHVN